MVFLVITLTFFPSLSGSGWWVWGDFSHLHLPVVCDAGVELRPDVEGVIVVQVGGGHGPGAEGVGGVDYCHLVVGRFKVVL